MSAEQILENFNEHFQNKYEVFEIYEKDGEAMIFANTNIAWDDGIFWYKDKNHIRAITPYAGGNTFKKIYKKENLVYTNPDFEKRKI